MSPALNLRKHHKPQKQWVLELATSMSQSAATLYYNGAKDLKRIYLTNDIKYAPWYESKHHANSHLNSEMKHAGFVAREHAFV
ncbi:MAG: hypothetical protein JKY26_01595 [Pseudomonas sp.]|nr:hypothetical protein [Pseudomonas sp.]